MKTLFTTIFLVSFAVVSGSYGFTADGGFETESISIPYYDDQGVFRSSISEMSSMDPELTGFISRHGNWTMQLNERTRLVRQGVGGSVFVGIPVDDVNAAELAKTFLQSEFDLLGVPVENLLLQSAKRNLNRWVVHFAQRHNNLEVFGSFVTVVISDRGNIVLFRSSYFPGIDTSPAPSLSEEAVRQSAQTGLSSAEYSATDPELIIMPLPAESGFDYRLAYRLEIKSDQPSRWLTVVNAHSGEVLYRKSLIYYETVDGYISGEIFEATPFDPEITMPFEFEVVSIDQAGQVYTDEEGFFTAEVDGPETRNFNTELRGYFVNVNNTDGADAYFDGQITPGETLQFEWDLNTARADERNCFFHTNFIHDYIKAIDPGFTLLDFPLDCNVNINQTCNAYWSGNAINFYRRGGGCENTGEIADVIYHEYGHGITDFQYRPSSPSGAQHEGWSDYIAATITDQPLIGRGFFGEGTYIRTVDNTNRWPDDWNGETHNDGLIVAGALWDLREALDPRVTYCDTLFHFARYNYSTDYWDYLIDILLVDDDDDDLYNGTPNSEIILAAFALHGIEPAGASFIHEPLGDTDDDSNPYPVTAIITAPVFPIDEDLVFVHHRAVGDDEFEAVQMEPTGNLDEYEGSIPAQPWGTLVEYYISATDVVDREFFHPAGAPDRTHIFVIGEPIMIEFDDLETETGWQVGAIDDDATSGIWERVDPNGTYADSDPNFPYQPEDDNTPEPGIYCFVTGQHPLGDPDNGANDVDGGKTTLYTPTYDLEGEEDVLIEYYRWYTIRTSMDDTFFVDISDDGGARWTNLEMVTSTENYWQRSRFLLEQFAEPTAQVMLRFVAMDRSPGSLVEAGVDDFAIYSFATTGTEPNSNTQVPARFALHQNYPNPFNGRTEISFDLAEQSDVEILIYDIAGRLVNGYEKVDLPAGYHSIVWDGRDNSGSHVASGVYLYELRAGEFSNAKKMLYLK